MFNIDFDRTIETALAPSELWRLIKEAFEDPAASPIWPVSLEEVTPITLQEGARVQVRYKLGPFHARPVYWITRYESGRSFSYRSDASHPLKGGATVEIHAHHEKGSILHWHGSYRPRLHPMAPGAVAFVRLYFLRTFFAHLEEKLHLYQETLPKRESHRSSSL